MCSSGPYIQASAVHQSLQCVNCTTWADSYICVIYNAEINEYPDCEISGKSVGKSEDEALMQLLQLLAACLQVVKVISAGL